MTGVSTKELDDILSGALMAAKWSGYDKAANTPGAHVSSTDDEIFESAKGALAAHIEVERKALLNKVDEMIALKVIAHANPMFVSEEVNVAIEQFANDCRASLTAALKATGGESET